MVSDGKLAALAYIAVDVTTPDHLPTIPSVVWYVAPSVRGEVYCPAYSSASPFLFSPLSVSSSLLSTVYVFGWLVASPDIQLRRCLLERRWPLAWPPLNAWTLFGSVARYVSPTLFLFFFPLLSPSALNLLPSVVSYHSGV